MLHYAEATSMCPPSFRSGGTGCERYSGLLEEGRWADLVQLFHADLFRLHSLPPVSLLNVHLQARACYPLRAAETPALLVTCD